MTPYRHKLFVYGTLMTGGAGIYGSEEREVLLNEAVYVGTAIISATLYDLGDYPAIVPSEAETDIVYGEVYALRDPERTFSWLDPYESTEPGDPTPSDYARVVRTVRMDDGTACSVWVYVYLSEPVEGRRIASGTWASRVQTETT